MKSYSFPYDNLQYQTYNTIASPFDDSDEDSIAIFNGNDDEEEEDGNDSDDEDEFPILYEQERPAYVREFQIFIRFFLLLFSSIFLSFFHI